MSLRGTREQNPTSTMFCGDLYIQLQAAGPGSHDRSQDLEEGAEVGVGCFEPLRLGEHHSIRTTDPLPWLELPSHWFSTHGHFLMLLARTLPLLWATIKPYTFNSPAPSRSVPLGWAGNLATLQSSAFYIRIMRPGKNWSLYEYTKQVYIICNPCLPVEVSL